MSEPAIPLRRLLPQPGETTTDEAIAGLALAERAPSGRPHLVLNMVATLDGKATIEGRTAGMGNAADRRIFHLLRTQVDAVMVGAGTLRAERYGRMIKDPELRERREREGLAGDPLAVLVSGRLDLPPGLRLLEEPEQPLVVVTASEGELETAAGEVSYLRFEGRVDFAEALRRLREDHGVRSVLCEGGPTLNAYLFEAGVVDELFLTLSPKVVGGVTALTIVAGVGLPEGVELEPEWILENEGHVFLRLRVTH